MSANENERRNRRDAARESIWSVSATWRTLFFAAFGVSTLIMTCVITAYLIANRGDAAIIETYMAIAEKVFVSGGALGLTFYSITETMETAMVFANYLRQNLLEPLKERQRMEGWEKGREEGLAEGRAEGLAKGIAQGRMESQEGGRYEGRLEGRGEGSLEAREEARYEGRLEGRGEGRFEADFKWRAWNDRRERAAASGEPFDEPPPSL